MNWDKNEVERHDTASPRDLIGQSLDRRSKEFNTLDGFDIIFIKPILPLLLFIVVYTCIVSIKNDEFSCVWICFSSWNQCISSVLIFIKTLKKTLLLFLLIYTRIVPIKTRIRSMFGLTFLFGIRETHFALITDYMFNTCVLPIEITSSLK